MDTVNNTSTANTLQPIHFSCYNFSMETKENNTPKFVKPLVMIIAAIVLIILIFVSIEDRKRAAYTIGFIGVPEEISTQVQKNLKSQFVGKIDYKFLSEDFEPTSKTMKGIDLIFMWSGSECEKFKQYSKGFQPFLYDNMIPSLSEEYASTENPDQLPVLWDPYILCTLKGTDKYYYLTIPESADEFEICLQGAKNIELNPLTIAGLDDRELLAFAGNLTLQMGGADAYKKLAETLRNERNLEKVCETVLGKTIDGKALTFENVIEKINSWQKENFINADMINFTSDNKLSSINNSKSYAYLEMLSDYKNLSDETAELYNKTVFPPEYSFENQCIIGRTLVMMNFSSKKITYTVAHYLTLTQIQGMLSAASKLIPVDQDTSVNDDLSANLMEYAGFCTSGIQNDLYSSSFNPEDAALFCEQLRNRL